MSRALCTVMALLLFLAVPRAAAQRTPTIAFLCPGSCSNLPSPIGNEGPAFLAGLERSGFVLGQNASIDMSGAGVGYSRLPQAVEKLVQRKVAVIVAFGNDATRAARHATPSIPIVMVDVADAVDEGLVASLARPGANVTGLSVPLGQIVAKQLELLKEINPRLTRVAILWNPAVPLHQARLARVERAARSLGVQVHPVSVATVRDLHKGGGSVDLTARDGLLLFEQLIGPIRPEITRIALEQRVVTVATDHYFVRGGGLLAYGPSLPDLFHRAAVYTGKLLKGARASEFPVEEPTRYELSLNRGTARALGLTIPPALLLRADHVIE